MFLREVDTPMQTMLTFLHMLTESLSSSVPEVVCKKGVSKNVFVVSALRHNYT